MNDSFAADIRAKARWARDHNERYPKPAWSTGEKLAVVLVLGHQGGLHVRSRHTWPPSMTMVPGTITGFARLLAKAS